MSHLTAVGVGVVATMNSWRSKFLPTAIELTLASTLVAPVAVAAEPLIPADEGAATAQGGYGRVFGRIVVIEEGKEKTLGVLDDFRVRLRKGDIVSTWTTTSYFAFLIVASVRGSGQWYAFTTPER